MGLFPKDRNLSLAPEQVELDVRASDFGLRAAALSIRLDAFLCRFLHWRSRTSVQRLIQDGFVDVALPAPERPAAPLEPRVETRNGRLLPHGARVVVRIPPELRLPDPVAAGADDLEILYEDDEVLAVDKPSGMPVHPSGRHMVGTLIQRVHARYAGEESGGELPIRLCHRLDRETSGIVLIAKDPRDHRRIMKQFERRQVDKEYLAIVHGHPEGGAGRIDLPLGPAHASRVHLKIAVTESGLPSVTTWRLLETAGAFSLLSCGLETGRQHQIRVHLAALGLPLVGDKLYGADEEVFLRASAGESTDRDHAELLLPRHALHNHRLVWTSPRTGERREVTSPLAPDLRVFLERSRRADPDA